MSENYYHNRTNRINLYVRENLAARISILMLDARKFSCAKIYTFTVYSGVDYVMLFLLCGATDQYVIDLCDTRLTHHH